MKLAIAGFLAAVLTTWSSTMAQTMAKFNIANDTQQVMQLVEVRPDGQQPVLHTLGPGTRAVANVQVGKTYYLKNQSGEIVAEHTVQGYPGEQLVAVSPCPIKGCRIKAVNEMSRAVDLITAGSDTALARIPPGRWVVAQVGYATELHMKENGHLVLSHVVTGVPGETIVARAPNVDKEPPLDPIEKEAPPPVEETIIYDEPDGPAASCDCDYKPGGCVISKAAPPGKACKCIYKPLWTCGGEVTSCGAMVQGGFQHLCDKPDKSILACGMGGGDCGGY